MSKLGAVAILAMATFASAQDCATEFGDESRCHGTNASQKRACCEGLECQQKDEWYGQCRPIGMDIPDGWDGTILQYGGQGAGGDGNADNGDGDMGDDEDVAGDDEAGDDEAGEDEAGDDEAGEDEAGEDEAVDDEAGEDEAGDDEAVDDEAVDDEAVDGDMDLNMEDDEDIGGDGMGVNTVPAAPEAGEVMYMAVAGKDYIPSMTPATTNLVSVEDIPEGAKTVADQKECEEFCTATQGCNAASFYNEPVGDNNCWLKILGDTCEVPSDALADPNAVLLLKFDDACMDDAMAPVGVAAMAPAAAPISDDGIDRGTPDFEGPDGDSGTAPADPPVVGDDTVGDGDTAGGILSVRGAAIAIAVAGAAVFL